MLGAFWFTLGVQSYCFFIFLRVWKVMISYRKSEIFQHNNNNKILLKLKKMFIRVGYSIKKKITDVDFYKDRDAQIEAIDRTFQAAQIPVNKLN
jgi:hypothetical protein